MAPAAPSEERGVAGVGGMEYTVLGARCSTHTDLQKPPSLAGTKREQSASLVANNASPFADHQKGSGILGGIFFVRNVLLGCSTNNSGRSIDSRFQVTARAHRFFMYAKNEGSSH